MKRHLYLLLALLIPLALAGCARTSDVTMSGEGPGGVATMDDDMREDAAERTAVPGDMLSGAMASNTIAQNAMAVAELSTLVRALQAADLVDVLNGPGPYTVFAPTNAAFDLVDADDMLAGTMDADAKAQLADLLKSHVVEGKVMFGELNNGEVVQTMSGADYTVGFNDNNMLEKRLNEADIIAYDIESSNGVIHVINLVLDDEGFFSQQ